MQVSIIIPTKNEEQRLPKLLTSIREQSFSDYEIIVADANSTDQTRKMAEQLGARVVDGGLPGIGRNRGAEVAQGETLIFFDADIILPDRNFLQDCLAEKTRRNLDIATCQVHALEGDLVDHALHHTYNLYTLAMERILPHVAGFCIFSSRVAHQSIHGFDSRVVFAEDHDYARRAHRMGYRTGILRSHKVPVSVRRLRKEGRFRLAMTYVLAELYMIFFGALRSDTRVGQWYLGNWEKLGDAMRKKT